MEKRVTIFALRTFLRIHMKWIIDNGNWIFSGIGVAIVIAIVNFLLKNVKKRPFSFQFLSTHDSLFLRINKNISEQNNVFNEYFSNIMESLKETQKHINEYNVFIDNRIEPLSKMNFFERIKPSAWTEIYKKADSLQNQCWNLQTQVVDQFEHLTIIKRRKDMVSRLLYPLPSPSLLNDYERGDVCCNMPSPSLPDDVKFAGGNMPSSSIYSRCRFRWIFISLFVLSLLLSIAVTFFNTPIATQISSLLNVDLNSVSSVINIIRIVLYVITAIPILFIAGVLSWVLIDEIKDRVSFRKRDGEMAKAKESKALRIVLFVLGSSFLVVSILSQSIIFGAATLIGIKNVSVFPQTMISVVALIIALAFIFASLYNAPMIRNIFISQDIERRYWAFEEETLEKLKILAADLDIHKNKSASINSDNSSAINELKTYTYDKIQAINATVLEKIHQFEMEQVKELSQCKTDFLIRLDRMQGEIHGIHEQVTRVDRIIEELKK